MRQWLYSRNSLTQKRPEMGVILLLFPNQIPILKGGDTLVQDILNEILQRLVRVETKLDALTDLRSKVDDIENKEIEIDARTKSNTHRIDRLEGANTWLWRAIVGAIIASLIGTVGIFIKKG
jgi:hypothetical protein